MIDSNKLRKLYENAYGCTVENVDITVTYHKVAKDLENRFTPPQTKDYFKKCDKCLKLYNDTTQLTYYVYYSKNADVPPVGKLMESFQQAVAILQYFGVTKYINIYIVMSPFKRVMPRGGNVISPEHINGGYTHPDGNEIFIIRSEEFSKVILHEILHHCKQVHSEAWTNAQINALKARFNIAKSTLLIPNEAVVEVWATLMHSMFTSFEYGVNWKDLVKIELKYSTQLCNNVLKLQQKMAQGWYENTNAYAYIIFKTILLKYILEQGLVQWDPEYVTNVLLMDGKTSIGKSVRNPSRSLRILMTSDF